MSQFGNAIVPIVPLPGQSIPDVSRSNELNQIKNALLVASRIPVQVFQSEAADVRRGTQLDVERARADVAEQDVETAKVLFEESQLKRDAYKSQLLTKEAREDYDKAKDIEELGIYGITSRMDNRELAKYFAENKAVDPKNQRVVANVLGNRLAAEAMTAIGSSMMERAANGEDPRTFEPTEDLRRWAEESGVNQLDPVTIAQFQRNSMGQVEAMHRGLITSYVRNESDHLAKDQARLRQSAIDSGIRAFDPDSPDEFDAEAHVKEIEGMFSLDPNAPKTQASMDRELADEISGAVIRAMNVGEDLEGIKSYLDSLTGNLKKELKNTGITTAVDNAIAEELEDRRKRAESAFNKRVSAYTSEIEKNYTAFKSSKVELRKLLDEVKAADFMVPEKQAGLIKRIEFSIQQNDSIHDSVNTLTDMFSGGDSDTPQNRSRQWGELSVDHAFSRRMSQTEDNFPIVAGEMASTIGNLGRRGRNVLEGLFTQVDATKLAVATLTFDELEAAKGRGYVNKLIASMDGQDLAGILYRTTRGETDERRGEIVNLLSTLEAQRMLNATGASEVDQKANLQGMTYGPGNIRDKRDPLLGQGGEGTRERVGRIFGAVDAPDDAMSTWEAYYSLGFVEAVGLGLANVPVEDGSEPDPKSANARAMLFADAKIKKTHVSIPVRGDGDQIVSSAEWALGDSSSQDHRAREFGDKLADMRDHFFPGGSAVSSIRNAVRLPNGLQAVPLLLSEVDPDDPEKMVGGFAVWVPYTEKGGNFDFDIEPGNFAFVGRDNDAFGSLRSQLLTGGSVYDIHPDGDLFRQSGDPLTLEEADAQHLADYRVTRSGKMLNKAYKMFVEEYGFIPDKNDPAGYQLYTEFVIDRFDEWQWNSRRSSVGNP